MDARRPLLMADEPTGDLGAHSAEEVLEILSRLNPEYKKTIIMAAYGPHMPRHRYSPPGERAIPFSGAIEAAIAHRSPPRAGTAPPSASAGWKPDEQHNHNRHI